MKFINCKIDQNHCLMLNFLPNFFGGWELDTPPGLLASLSLLALAC